MARLALLKAILWLLVSVVAYLDLGYFTERSNFAQVILLFGITFAAYIGLVKSNLPLQAALLAAVVFRLLFLFSWPALSDDYFRFMWDGRLLAAGQNPYLKIPFDYLNSSEQIPGLTLELYQQLNSPTYFTVYPPVCQFIFGTSAWLSSSHNQGMVVSMRLVILLAELGNIYIILQLLRYYQKPLRLVLWYALNPLVIVELTGNLHFEALLLFFLLSSMHLLIQKKLFVAGTLFGLSIGVKLLPFIFLPFVLAQLGWKQFIIFASAVAISLIVLFLPFLSAALFQNMGQSLDLYFQKFEFNASIYYLLRWLGSLLLGYNPITMLGPILSLLTLLTIAYVALNSRKNPKYELPAYFLFALSVYFFLTTTVHPWYLTTLVALAAFTSYRYVIVWSGAAILSYTTYQTQAYHENLYLTILEYSLVFGWLIWEVIQWRRIEGKRNNALAG